MKKFWLLIALVVFGGLLVSPKIVSAEEAAPTGTSMTSPAVSCFQNNGMWRVYDHLVIAMEWCTRIEVSPPDVLTLFMDSSGNPQNRCEHYGGRFEFIGSKTGFNLNICWNRDYIVVPEPAETRTWDGKSPRVCVDFDGDDVVENQYGVETAYTVVPSNLNKEGVDATMNLLRTRFSQWNVTFEKGECLDSNSSTLYVTTEPAAAQSIIASGTDGYAWLNGFGSTGWNMGFVFTRYLNNFGVSAVAVHEVGHMFGLDHPYNNERYIMSDGHDNTLDFSPSDKVLLDAWFVNYRAV